MNDKLLIMPLGGLEQIGANCTLIGYKDNWIMVDLGISFCNKLGVEVITPDKSFPINLKNFAKPMQKKKKKLKSLTSIINIKNGINTDKIYLIIVNIIMLDILNLISINPIVIPIACNNNIII